MRKAIIARCQNGIVVWVPIPIRPDNHKWRCLRDGFEIALPTAATQFEQFLVAMAQHTVALAGNILQLVELEL